MSDTTRRSVKLSTKIIAGICLIAVTGLVVAFFVVNTFVRNPIYDVVIDGTQSNMTIYANELDSWFENIIYALDGMAVAYANIDEESIRNLTVHMVSEFDAIVMTFIGFADENRVISGQLPYGWTPPPGWYVHARPWHYYAMIGGGASVFTEPYISTAYPYSMVVSAGRYMPEMEGTVVVGIDIVLTDIMDLLDSYEVQGDGYLFLVSPGGNIVSHPDAAIAPAPGRDLLNIRDVDVYATFFEIGTNYGIGRFHSPFLGTNSYMMTFPMTTTGWTLVSVFPVAVVDGPTQAALWTIMAVVLILIIAFAVVVIAIFMPAIFRPIRRINSIILDVSRGKMDIERKINLNNDEMGQLAQSTYHLVDVIKSLLDDLDKFNHETNTVGDIEYRMDESRYEGAYKEILAGINAFTDGFMGDMLKLINVVRQEADGVPDIDIPVLPGKKHILTETLKSFDDTLRGVYSAIKGVSESAAKGRFDIVVDASKFKGAWGDLIGELNNFVTAVQGPLHGIASLSEAMQQGDFHQRIHGTYEGEFLQITQALNTTVDAVSSYIDEIDHVLARVATGDLQTHISRDYVGSFDTIKHSVNAIVVRLNETFEDIGYVATGISSGSAALSQNAMDLSEGVARQMASMREMTGGIGIVDSQATGNATNAQKAADLALISKNNAETGNSEMQQLLGAMERITVSSKKIENIIKTIEGIAFQTNLLALNASVEAARAGEHGRGFSVVAEEVGTLAGRSAEAAKQTAELIRESIGNVDEGTKAASDTAASLAKIVQNVLAVSDVINDIFKSSNQQTTTIGNINNDLNQINNAVQDSASTSQETAAAAQQLDSQVSILKDRLSFFLKQSQR